MTLIIVESPTKAKTLSRFLGKDYQIEATLGHIRDLPKGSLGIDVDHDFQPSYELLSDRKKRVTELKRLAKATDRIILATDPDREGEAIAYHVEHVISSNSKIQNPKSKMERIVFHEITETAIKDALAHPRSIDLQLVDAQQARRVLDRLVGYKLSPLLWNKLGKRWLSAGRVQSVAVRVIVEREREIQAFKSVEYWIINVELSKLQRSKDTKTQREDKNFNAKLSKINNEKAEVGNKEQADGIIGDLEKADYKVVNIETKEVRRFPSPPFTTSTLQQTASNKFSWSARRTMQTAQKLYEEGFITYHRTDSTNLSNDSIAMVRDFITKEYGPKYLPAAPKLYKTKSKVAQEAHEAIRPTKLDKSREEEVTASLGREGYKLYELIAKRFIACQMNEALFEQTGIDIEATASKDPSIRQPTDFGMTGSYLLRAGGQRMVFDGFTRVYEIANGDKEEENADIPKLVQGEDLSFVNVVPEQKFTEPPPRYNEASLIKILEEKGIGRPSTYAPIISTIQDRRYVEKIERAFHPTDLGFAVNDFLVKYFPVIFDISFTAKMEDNLDEIANGKIPWVPVIKEFYDPMSSQIEKVQKEVKKVEVSYGETDEKCQLCGAPMIVRMSRFGKFLACTRFPECKYKKSIVQTTGIKCPKCGGDVIVKKTRRGKSFYGCANYPKCDFAAWKKSDIVKV